VPFKKTFIFIFLIFAGHTSFSQFKTFRDTIFVKRKDFNNPNLNHHLDLFSRLTKQISSSKDINSSGTKNAYTVTGTISLAITSTGTTCGYSNGTFTVTASGGTAPYTYSENGYPFQSSDYFFALAPGVYNITAEDAAGISATASVTLTNTFPPPTLNYTGYTNPAKCSGTDGTVTLQASGGTPPYTYSDDDIHFQTSPVITNLSAGTYSFIVEDANGCQAPYYPVYLGYYCAINYMIGYPASVCGNNGYIIIVNPAGGTAPYQYSLDGVNYQSTGTFSNLLAGLYTIYVKDATGALDVFSVQEFPGCPVSVIANVINASCGNNNGSISITPSNGASPYFYSLDGINFQTSNIFNELAAGNYSITVRDAKGTFGFLSLVTVSSGCPTLTLNTANDTCNKNDGSITIAGASGLSPYTYSIDGTNFQNNNIFSGLAPGNYVVTIKDASGFTAKAKDTIYDICISLADTVINSICGSNNGSIIITATNGLQPYQYSIDGINFQNNDTLSNLNSGNYIVTVKDSNGTTNSINVVITGSPGPTIIVATTAAACNNSGGAITITHTGGTAPFQYSIDGSIFQGSNIFTNVSSGTTYQPTIKDANGCIATMSTIVSLDCPTIIPTISDETCSKRNGTISLISAHGVAPYQYSLDGTNFQTSNIFSGLTSGAYTIVVKDADGYLNKTSVIVNNICPTVTASADNGLCGIANGAIIAIGANGTPPYQYSIDGINFLNSNNFIDLPTAIYTVTVKDANGLTDTTSVFVNNFPGPQITASSGSASCKNNDGVITINNIGGTSPLLYSINGINFQGGNSFLHLASGNYNATIKDANGCAANQQINVALINNLTISTGNTVTICQGTTTSLPASSNGNNFVWLPNINLNNATLLNPTAAPPVTTEYYITAILGGCSAKDSVLVFVNPAPVANAGIDTTICYGKSVQLNGSGGVAYSWTPITYLDNGNVANPNVINPPATMTYNLTVTDGNDCKSLEKASVIVNVTPPPKIFAGNDTSILINQYLQLNAVDINNSGFTQYTWSPSFGLNDASVENPDAHLTEDITYTVVASTPDGCEGTDSISIKVYTVSDIFVPNAFTPNGDGKDDIFRVIPIGIKELKYFAVFNRWGQRIFYTTTLGSGWDGTVNGKPQDAGTFIWMAAGINYKGDLIEKKGAVVLIR
jgi:gliding motility-associated-like protein